MMGRRVLKYTNLLQTVFHFFLTSKCNVKVQSHSNIFRSGTTTPAAIQFPFRGHSDLFLQLVYVFSKAGVFHFRQDEGNIKEIDYSLVILDSDLQAKFFKDLGQVFPRFVN